MSHHAHAPDEKKTRAAIIFSLFLLFALTAFGHYVFVVKESAPVEHGVEHEEEKSAH